MSLFDGYVFVDWSAANRPSPRRPTRDAVWVGWLTRGFPHQPETKYHRTRAAGVSHVRSILMEHATKKRRVLVGFDFPYGYPSGFARTLGLPAGPQLWCRIWAQLADRIQDGDNNVNSRFAVAAELNSAIAEGGHAGPFWGCPANAVGPNLRPQAPEFPFGVAGGILLQRLRLVEERLRGTQEVWKLFYAGSAGGQALVGIPYVHMLRSDCGLSECSRVWPFETGFTRSPSPDRGPFILHAEIWPGIIEEEVQEMTNADPSLIRDQAQVRAMCEWAAELDERNGLGRLFSIPNRLSPQEIETCTNEEGWILGAPDV